MSKKSKNIEVKGISISVFQTNKDDYISLTDIAKSKDGDSRAADIIKNWILRRYEEVLSSLVLLFTRLWKIYISMLLEVKVIRSKKIILKIGLSKIMQHLQKAKDPILHNIH